jgi:hypothetical protein
VGVYVLLGGGGGGRCREGFGVCVFEESGREGSVQ